MAKYKLINNGLNVTTIYKGQIVSLAEGQDMTTDDPELARELSRWKYVELQGELPKEEEAPPLPISEDLQKLSRKELAVIAVSLEIPVKSKMNKKTLRAAIVAARK